MQINFECITSWVSFVYELFMINFSVMRASLCILFLLTISFSAKSQTETADSIAPSVLLGNIEKTLKAATSMSIITCAYQATGLSFIVASQREWDSDVYLAVGLTAGIGGVGMGTNVSILTGKAYRHFKSWKCPGADSLFKKRILRNIKTARNIAILQDFMPFIGLAAGGIASAISNDKKDTFYIVFVSACIAGMVLTVPEMILLENVRHDLKQYQRHLDIGLCEHGIGLVYNF